MRPRTFLYLGLTAALLSLPLVASAQDKAAQPSPRNKASQTFLQNAIEGNYAEIEMGQLAEQKGQTDQVKSFGTMLVQDHQAANDKALDAAKTLGMNPPSGPSAKEQADYNKMSKMSDASFDRAFARDMASDHRKVIRDYERASRADNAAGQYAKDSLPTLEKHLRTAQSLESGK
jgi:putative membrane protein